MQYNLITKSLNISLPNLIKYQGIVVDEYFVPSLEVIATVLNMSPDVAGATVSDNKKYRSSISDQGHSVVSNVAPVGLLSFIDYGCRHFVSRTFHQFNRHLCN